MASRQPSSAAVALLPPAAARRRPGGRLLPALLALLALGAGLAPARAATHGAPKVAVELLSQVEAVVPGATFWIGLSQQIAPGWHTYWLNPGDSGEPTRIEWEAPPGFVMGDIAWPHPERIPVGPAMSYGYAGRVVLAVPVTAPADLVPGGRVTLRGRASWLVCEKICIPEEAAVALSLPVAAAATPDPRGAPLIARARRAVPTPAPWPATYTATDEMLTLTVAAPGLVAERIAELWFYPARWGVIEHAAPQRARVDATGLTIEAARGPLPEATAGPIEGVLVMTERLDGETAHQAFTVRAAPGAMGAGPAVLHAVALALLGGLVLNLMPCVLPVLSVKALGLVGHAAGSSASIRAHGLAYTAGVLASFAALAGTLIALRAAGERIGWGFQLQSPAFVTFLAYVLFVMALALSGVLVFGSRLGGLGQSLAERPGLGGSFFVGALAAVAATPCTAPFMGAAVGFALTQPWSVALLVFEALGLGLALPYLGLTLMPAWRRFLPRPGAWMRRLEQFLAFPLYASVAWLVWVLSRQAGPTAVGAVLAGLVLLGLAAWLHGAAAGARGAWRHAARVAVAALAAGAVALGPLAGAATAPGPDRRAGGDEAWSAHRVAQLTGQGRPVFVNVTADWCITCLVNERVALRSASVARAFADKGVVLLTADWTRRDPAITEVLGAFGRSGVPLYLLYPAAPAGRSTAAAPTVLPQILSERAVIEAIDRI